MMGHPRDEHCLQEITLCDYPCHFLAILTPNRFRQCNFIESSSSRHQAYKEVALHLTEPGYLLDQ